jgi:8-amino-3,8-dideoxy-alpha-D-manno-octulosonate transaminase
MPGTELFGEEEKKEVMDVLEHGRAVPLQPRCAAQGHWKAKDFEAEIAQVHRGEACAGA